MIGRDGFEWIELHQLGVGHLLADEFPLNLFGSTRETVLRLDGDDADRVLAIMHNPISSRSDLSFGSVPGFFCTTPTMLMSNVLAK